MNSFIWFQKACDSARDWNVDERTIFSLDWIRFFANEIDFLQLLRMLTKHFQIHEFDNWHLHLEMFDRWIDIILQTRTNRSSCMFLMLMTFATRRTFILKILQKCKLVIHFQVIREMLKLSLEDVKFSVRFYLFKSTISL
jgi:hypothetical protein